MKTEITKLLFVAALALSSNIHGQPLIPEDRMYLKVSTDVIKLEQNIYLPNFPGKLPALFYRWVYDYSHGLLVAERSFSSSDLTKVDSEKLFEYDRDGKVTKDNTYYPSLPELNSQTTYEYSPKGMLIKATQVNTTTKKMYRVDTYRKYKSQTSYEKSSQFFGDDNEKTVKYISVYENGLKQTIIYTNGFPPVLYEYDSTGKLIAINSRKYFYKLDERGNAIAAVQLERGMRIYNFIRITYADGSVTGSLEPNKDFIQEWDNRN